MTITSVCKIRIIGLIVLWAVSLQLIEIKAASADVSVYDDALASGWDNWSWNSTLNFLNSSPMHGGAKSLSVKYNSAWAGLYLHTYAGYDTSLYDRLSFWIHGGSSGNQRFIIVANGDSANTYEVTAQANTWTQVVVPLSSLGNPAMLTDLYWQDATGGAQPTFYLDDITLLAGSAPSTPLTLSINVSTDRHAINADIYGMNFADEALAAELRLPVRRWGGNSATRYNWQTSMKNSASDWYFENLPEGSVNVANLPDGSASDQFVEQDRRTGTKTLLTMPLIGWTVKSTSPRIHPYDCGFKVSKYGSQESVDQWDRDCGNGVRSSGGNISGNNPSDTSDAIDAGFVEAWINHLTGKYGTAAADGVAYYNLDNEPMLWNSTHRDVHPQPVSYDEILDRSLQYAAAIKAADPSAKTLGPVAWGWCAYFYSALDGCGIGADYQSHGNMPFVPWYLNQLNAFEHQPGGKRLLDYLDLHYYPQAGGVALSSAGSASTQALRLRSTRSLWDANYTDESWISDTEPGGVKVRLIGRMRDWVDTYYPGTKLAITEYNWGGLESINGALAQADVLGIFGREGLDLATLWSPPAVNQPGAYAFRMFLNYDGTGQRFGDVSVQATSSDYNELAVYAAQRSSDNALTVVVVNKTANDLTSPVDIAGMALPSSAAVYRYSTANLSAIVQMPDQAMNGSGFSAVFSANSITLFVITPSGGNDVTLTVTKVGTGGGNVAASEGTIIWNGNTGAATYGYGTQVTLSAVADTGSTFDGWTGCDSSSGGNCSVTMTASKSVTAMFIPQNCTFSISPSSISISNSGGKGSVNTTATSSSCNWTAASNVSWVTLRKTDYTGSAKVDYSVARNRTGSNRTGTLTIAGVTFTITQSK